MFNISTTTNIYLYTAAADMRKGFDGLSGLVRSELGGDPLDGSMFLFVNRRRDRMKILQWDGGGFWLYYRRLEAGTFEIIKSEDKQVQIDATQLAMILSGISLESVKQRKRYRRAA